MSRINPFHPLNDLLAEDVPATPYSEPGVESAPPIDEATQLNKDIHTDLKDAVKHLDQATDKIANAVKQFRKSGGEWNSDADIYARMNSEIQKVRQRLNRSLG